MSSSQGANADTTSVAVGSDEYAFSTIYIRDASDWIRYKKEARVYKNYKSDSGENMETEPAWLKYGNQFRLAYSFGRWKCDANCEANAFRSAVGDIVTIPPTPPCSNDAPPGVTCVVDLTGITFDGTGDPGHRYNNKFILGFGISNISFGFSNACNSNIGSTVHIQFDTYTADGGSTLSPGDTFTIDTPSYGPAGTYTTAPGRQILYDNNTYNLTPTSIVTLANANPLSIISFEIF